MRGRCLQCFLLKVWACTSFLRRLAHFAEWHTWFTSLKTLSSSRLPIFTTLWGSSQPLSPVLHWSPGNVWVDGISHLSLLFRPWPLPEYCTHRIDPFFGLGILLVHYVAPWKLLCNLNRLDWAWKMHRKVNINRRVSRVFVAHRYDNWHLGNEGVDIHVSPFQYLRKWILVDDFLLHIASIIDVSLI